MALPQRKSFMLYHDFENLFRLLDMEQRGALITAIFEYETQNTLTSPLPDLANMAFCCIKNTLDRDRETYRAKCEVNAQNGKKGGRPPKRSSAEETERFFSEPKKPDSDKDSDSDRDRDNDSESDTDKEREREYELPHAEDTSTQESCGASDQKPSNRHREEASFPASRSASLLREEEKEELWRRGVPPDYFQAREERALRFAASQGRSAEEVLWEWWQSDRKTYSSSSRSGAAQPSENKSYDVEDFFKASLARSYEQLAEDPPLFP